jgi:hypothetical protein
LELCPDPPVDVLVEEPEIMAAIRDGACLEDSATLAVDEDKVQIFPGQLAKGSSIQVGRADSKVLVQLISRIATIF